MTTAAVSFIREAAASARTAARQLASLPTAAKDAALNAIADRLLAGPARRVLSYPPSSSSPERSSVTCPCRSSRLSS